VIPDARVDPLVRDNPSIAEHDYIAYAGVPLFLSNGDAVGAFCAVDHRPRAWSRPDMEILDDLAVAATEILDGRAALVHHDLHDRLTGLPNRELLVAAADDFLCDVRAGEKVAVLCAGLDHFAMVNQAFGAEKADRVLRAVADRLVAAVRETDVFGRLRGDVFAVVAPGIEDETEALKLAARIHRVLSYTPLDIEGRSSRSASRSESGWGPRARPAPTSSPTPPTRCAKRSATRAACGSPSAATPRTLSPTCGCASSSTSPASATRSCPSSSRSSRWRPAASPATRRSPAGRARRSARSPRPTSSRSPN
jgi:diguanylate cyclase (GGDEF)-like protein